MRTDYKNFIPLVNYHQLLSLIALMVILSMLMWWEVMQICLPLLYLI